MSRVAKALLFLFAVVPLAAGSDWPQWRGPDRTNHSTESGLLKEWPTDGPPLLWKSPGLGQGVPGVSVAGGKIYVLGYREGKEFLNAISEKDGKQTWSTSVGPAAKEISGMRWLSQRTPTVDGDRVYAFTAQAELICLNTADGKEVWRKDYVVDFGAKAGPWGFCDYPLVDGDNLICTPGAADAAIVALDKKSGAVVWKCAIEKSVRHTYCGAVAAEIAGTRQYVHQLEVGVVGVAAKDGKLLWHYPNFGESRGNVHTAIVRGDEVFASCGWGVGAALLRIKKDGGSFKVEEVYRNKTPLDQWLGSSVRIGEFVHTSNGACAKWKTGEAVAQEKGLPTGRITMTAADGRLIYRGVNGRVTLVEIAVDGKYAQVGDFKVAPAAREPTWTFPVVANGRLYLRDQDVLSCYELRAEKPRKPHVIFVPTPHDVVEKMLEQARVTKADTVVDLGCGDGRIVVTAAKKYGCKAIGYDLDPECIKLSRAAVEKAGVGKLVTIEEADLLEIDFSGATVVTIYLGAALNAKLVPKLEKLKPGSRIVSHFFPIPGVKPDKTVMVTSAEDDVERPIYLYSIPLVKEKK